MLETGVTVITVLTLALFGYVWYQNTALGMKLVKMLLWPSWFFIARRYKRSGISPELKRRILAALRWRMVFWMSLPHVIWWFGFILASSPELRSYALEFIGPWQPATLRTLPAVFGKPALDIYSIPLPFLVVSADKVLHLALPIWYYVIFTFFSNRAAAGLMSVGDFESDFKAALLANRAAADIDEKHLPRVKALNGLAQIDANGTSFGIEQLVALSPKIQPRMRCSFISVRKKELPHQLEVIYSYSPFPESMPFGEWWRPGADKNTVAFGHNMYEQVSQNLQKVPHILISGMTGFGKTVTLDAIFAAAFMADPNTVLILLDPSPKDAVDFGHLKYDPDERAEHLRGRLAEFEVSPLAGVLVARSYKEVFALISWARRQLQDRSELCGDIKYLAPDLDTLEQKPAFQSAQGQEFIPPRIFLAMDEVASLRLIETGGGRKDDDLTQAREDLSVIIQTGRAFKINVILSLQSARFKDLGYTRKQLESYSMYQKPGEVELALDVKHPVTIPKQQGVFAYSDGYGYSLGKSYLIRSDETAQVIKQQFSKARKVTQRCYASARAAQSQILANEKLSRVDELRERALISEREVTIHGNGVH